MENRIYDHVFYKQYIENRCSRRNFSLFCKLSGMTYQYITRENKNSVLFYAFVTKHRVKLFGKKIPMMPEDFLNLDSLNHIPLNRLVEEKTYTIWREVFIHKLLNDVVLNRYSPHFPLFYGHYFSFDREPFAKSDRPHLILLQERMSEDLKTWALGKERTPKQWMDCFLQLFFAIWTMKTYIGITHTDLHWGNVLVTPLEKPLTWTYEIQGKHYCLTRQDFLFTICDFGFCQFFFEDELKDFRRIPFHIFKWMEKDVPPVVQTFLDTISPFKHTNLKEMLEGGISQFMERERKGLVFPLSKTRINFIEIE